MAFDVVSIVVVKSLEFEILLDQFLRVGNDAVMALTLGKVVNMMDEMLVEQS